MHVSEGTGAAAAACEALRGGINLVAGDAKILELTITELHQFADSLAIALVGADPGKKKSDEHGNSPFEAEAMVAFDGGDPASGPGYKTGLRLSERTVPSPIRS
jgi:hypothetical protein